MKESSNGRSTWSKHVTTDVNCASAASDAVLRAVTLFVTRSDLRFRVLLYSSEAVHKSMVINILDNGWLATMCTPPRSV